MIPALYFALSGGALLIALVIWRTSAMTRRFSSEEYFSRQDYAPLSGPDYSCLQLGPRIFDPVDSGFVARETSAHFARRFREERTLLALQWLNQIRRHTNFFMRIHAKAARSNTDLRVQDELALGFDFLLFQLTIGILYCAVWLRGPFHAARLVRYSLTAGRHFDRLTRDLVSASPSFVADPVVVVAEPPRRNRSAASG